MEKNNSARDLAEVQLRGDSRGFLSAEFLRVCHFVHGTTSKRKCLTGGFTVLLYEITYEFGVDDIESGSP